MFDTTRDQDRCPAGLGRRILGTILVLYLAYLGLVLMQSSERLHRAPWDWADRDWRRYFDETHGAPIRAVTGETTERVTPPSRYAVDPEPVRPSARATPPTADWAREKSEDVRATSNAYEARPRPTPYQDARDYTTSTYEVTRVGWRVMNADPRETAHRLMEDEECQQDVERRVDRWMDANDRMGERLEQAQDAMNRLLDRFGGKK